MGFKEVKYILNVFGDREALLRFDEKFRNWKLATNRGDDDGDTKRYPVEGGRRLDRLMAGWEPILQANGTERRLKGAKHMTLHFEIRPDVPPCPLANFVAEFPELGFSGSWEAVDGATFEAVNGHYQESPYIDGRETWPSESAG